MTIADDRRPGAAANRPGSRPFIRRVNRVIRGLQQAGIVFGPMHVLTVRGRKTGRPRATPVAVIPVGGARYVFQAYPGASWVANATAAAGPWRSVMAASRNPGRLAGRPGDGAVGVSIWLASPLPRDAPTGRACVPWRAVGHRARPAPPGYGRESDEWDRRDRREGHAGGIAMIVTVFPWTFTGQTVTIMGGPGTF